MLFRSLLLVVWITTATLIGFQFRQQQPGYRYQFRTSAVLLLQSVPLMLVLFVLFPRVSGPLWGMPQDALAGSTGLSDEMSPGSVSKLLTSDAVAFRATFRSEVPRANQLYWRGPVMWDFDGYTWTASRFGNALQRPIEYEGNAIDYTVTVEPHNRRWLFGLDLPTRAPAPARLTGDFQILSPTPVSRRTRYDMLSYPAWRDVNELTSTERSRALALPPRTSQPRAHGNAGTARSRRARVEHDQPRIVDPAVVVGKAAPEFRLEALAMPLGGETDIARGRQGAGIRTEEIGRAHV